MSKIDITNVRSYIETLDKTFTRKPPEGYKYSSQHNFLMGEGREFKGGEFTPEEIKTIRSVIENMSSALRVKECYRNAYLLAEMGEKEGFVYAEGMAAGPIPVDHAWVVFNGKPVDATWRAVKDTRRDTNQKAILDRIVKNAATESYFGIEAPIKYVRQRVFATRRHLSIIDDYDARWPLLKKGCVFA